VHGVDDGRRPIPVPAGRYGSVTVIAAGDWTVALGPLG